MHFFAAAVEGNGPQPVRLALLLRGTGQKLREGEKQAYRDCPGVQVYFQSKAGASTKVMLAWLEQFHIDTLDVARRHGTRILGFDGLGSHLALSFQQRCLDLTSCASACRQTALTFSPP